MCAVQLDRICTEASDDEFPVDEKVHWLKVYVPRDSDVGDVDGRFALGPVSTEAHAFALDRDVMCEAGARTRARTPAILSVR